MAVNNNVKLFNNTTLNSLDPLKIGIPDANNTVCHVGLGFGNHGSDLQIGNYAKNGDFDGVCYMLKAGQGGSQIKHWYNGGLLYSGIYNPWTTFVARNNAFRQLIPEGAIQPTILFLGINDALANTDPALFKTHTQSFISDIKAQLGGTNHIYFVHIPLTNASFQAIDDVITEIANEDTFVHDISVVGAMNDMRDSNHFGYLGHKLIVDRVISQVKIDYNI